MRPLLVLTLALFACNKGEDPNSKTDKDADRDGVIDSEDICPGFDDRLDRDADAVPDGCDACPDDAAGTDDEDADGICNRDDRCPGSDDAQDADGDGVCDAIDRCPDDALPLEDTDLDGNCNSDDLCEGFDDVKDKDGDGVPNGCDACPDDALDDSDFDGRCDSDDMCQGFDDSFDLDGDGLPDDCDPCPEDTPNDSDQDGVCNSVDPCPFDRPDDTDGDTICDSDDRCPLGDDTIDVDADGWPDFCDPCPGDAGNSCIVPTHGLEAFTPTNSQGQFCYGDAPANYFYYGELTWDECEAHMNGTATQPFVGISSPFPEGWIGAHDDTLATATSPYNWTTESVIAKTSLRSCTLADFDHRTEPTVVPMEQLYFDVSTGRAWHFWDILNQTHSQAISFADDRGARIINPAQVGMPNLRRITPPTHWCHAGAEFNGNGNCNSDQICDFMVGYYE